MVIFSEFHLSACSDTIDINVICQFCNKPHILPGFTLIPHKSNVIKMDIMDTYFFCWCLIPPDYGDRDISVQHLDIIKINIIDFSFGKLFRISAKQNLNIEQFLFCLLYSDIFIMYIMNMAAICLMDGNRRTTHVSFILAVYDVTVFKYQVVDFALEGITKLYGITGFCIPDHVIVNTHFCYVTYR